MKKNATVRKFLAALLCVCLAVGNLVWVNAARADYDGSANAPIRNVNSTSPLLHPDGQAIGDRTTDQVSLLVGTDPDNPLRGETLNETVQKYADTYMLDVAADFCVFLKENFVVYDSDAEGRVAVGGDIVLNNEYGSYAIGAGDFSHVTELDALLKDRVGAATIILGGALTQTGGHNATGKSQLSDIYYYQGVKYEGPGNQESPTHKSSRKLVVNMNVSNPEDIPDWANQPYNPYWVEDHAIPPQSPYYDTSNYDWMKVDQSQTYITHLIDFETQFTNLKKYSTWLNDDVTGDQFDLKIEKLQRGVDELPEGVADWNDQQYNPDKQNDDGTTGGYDYYWGNDVNVLTITYKGSSEIRDCVYLDLNSGDYDKYFKDATVIVFENIPVLTDAPRKVINNDGKTWADWNYAYIIINIPDSGEIHVGNLNNYDGGKVTVINGENISRIAPSQNWDDKGNEIGGTMNNHPGVSSVMYNFVNAQRVVLANNFQGTIFAPNSNVTDEKYIKVQEGGADKKTVPHGHLSGAIVANSFTGYTEFGYRPFSGSAIIETGVLEVIKTISGATPSTTDTFAFTVTLSNRNIAGKYGDMDFAQGVAHFELHHGEVKKATLLPPGISYTVEETNSGNYTTGVIGENGTIIETKSWKGSIEPGNTSTVRFVNTKINEEVGHLSITKTVAGIGADTQKPFLFTVTLSNRTISGKYGDMTFVNGVASVTLTHGKTAIATGLPAGITYTVSETIDPDYAADKPIQTGDIVAGQTATAQFINTKIVDDDDDNTDDGNDGEDGNTGDDNTGDTGNEGEVTKVGSLRVSKTVTGKGADKTKAFRFTVTLSQQITQKFGEMSFVNGVATFTLKDGESMQATGLPAGVTYTVVEDNADSYVTTKSGDSGAITADKLSEAIFINAYVAEETKTEVPKTGDAFPLTMWLSLTMLAMVGLYLARKGKKN